MAEAAGHRVRVTSASRAEDGAYLALADIAVATRASETEYRVIGGHMVTIHTARHILDVPLRQTRDADLGLEVRTLTESGLPAQLDRFAYRRSGGNRFIRQADGTDLVIDVLIPADTSRVRHNRPVGDLVVDEVPGLRYTLSRPPYIVDLSAELTSGTVVRCTLKIPDAIAALCLKAAAFSTRHETRDAVDVWRLLEVLNADGMTARAWPATTTARETAEILRHDFLGSRSPGLLAATQSASERVRIRALVAGVIGNDPG